MYVRKSPDFSDVGSKLSPFPFFLIFEQSKNERLLYDYLQHNGKDVRWQTEMESLKQDADGVTVVTKAKNGEKQTIEAKYLVGCDGASSSTRLFYVADVELEYQGDQESIELSFSSITIRTIPNSNFKQLQFDVCSNFSFS